MENEKELLARITVNPKIFNGKPIIRGLRISVEMILDLLSQGISEKEILEDYPDLDPEDIRACFVYAKSIISNEKIDEIQFEKEM